MIEINGLNIDDYKIDYILNPGDSNELLFKEKMEIKSIEYGDGINIYYKENFYLIKKQFNKYFAYMKMTFKISDTSHIIFPCKIKTINVSYKINDTWYNDTLMDCIVQEYTDCLKFQVDTIVRGGHSLRPGFQSSILI